MAREGKDMEIWKTTQFPGGNTARKVQARKGGTGLLLSAGGFRYQLRCQCGNWLVSALLMTQAGCGRMTSIRARMYISRMHRTGHIHTRSSYRVKCVLHCVGLYPTVKMRARLLYSLRGKICRSLANAFMYHVVVSRVMVVIMIVVVVIVVRFVRQVS